MSLHGLLEWCGDDTLEQRIERAVHEHIAAQEAERQAERQRVAEAEARRRRDLTDRVQIVAMRHGARSPDAAETIACYAASLDLFEVREDAIVAKGEARRPTNPLRPLEIDWWMEQVSRTHPYLFVPPGHV